MVLANSDQVPRVWSYSGSHLGLQYFNYRTLTFFGRLSQIVRLYCFFPFLWSFYPMLPWFGLFPFRSPLLRESIFFFLFLQVLRCFNSLGLPPSTLSFQVAVIGFPPIGFPHSDITRSLLTYSSLMRFAVSCVLLRLLVPRHPPCALFNLT